MPNRDGRSTHVGDDWYLDAPDHARCSPWPNVASFAWQSGTGQNKAQAGRQSAGFVVGKCHQLGTLHPLAPQPDQEGSS